MATSHSATKAAARRQFDGWARSYDRSILNRLLFGPSYEIVLEELVAWRGNGRTPFSVLDVGCGTGSLAALLAASSLPARVIGLDYAAVMCVIATEKARLLGITDRARFLNADSEHLPFADESFDAVTCGNSFHHYPEQQRVVCEFRRVLRPGGRLVLVDGFRDNVVGWLVFDVGVATVEKGVHHAPWSKIRGYCQRAGLGEIRQRKYGVWVPRLLTVATRV